MLAGGIVYVSFEIFLRIIVLFHTESTENTEIIYSNTDRTDLTDFYIPMNFLILCPAEPKVGALGEAKWRKGRKGQKCVKGRNFRP